MILVTYHSNNQKHLFQKSKTFPINIIQKLFALTFVRCKYYPRRKNNTNATVAKILSALHFHKFAINLWNNVLDFVGGCVLFVDVEHKTIFTRPNPLRTNINKLIAPQIRKLILLLLFFLFAVVCGVGVDVTVHGYRAGIYIM